MARQATGDNSHLNGIAVETRDVILNYNLGNHGFGGGKSGFLGAEGRFAFVIEDAAVVPIKDSNNQKHNLRLTLRSIGPVGFEGTEIRDFKPIQGNTWIDDVLASVWSGLDKYEQAKATGPQGTKVSVIIGKKCYAKCVAEKFEGDDTSKPQQYISKTEYERMPGPFSSEGGDMGVRGGQGGGQQASGGQAAQGQNGAAQNGAASGGQANKSAVSSLLGLAMD